MAGTGGSGPSARLSVQGLQSPLSGPHTFAVAAGRCAVITGPSGSGKSLFLRMVADLDPNRGAAWLDGRERAGFAPAEWRRQVVYLAAEAGWWAETVAQHLPRASLERARELAGRLGLDAGLIQAPVARLSTGEKQRMALVRALLLASPVLLLDEPTGALDQASVGQVERLIRTRLDEGVAVVMVTHDAALADRLADDRYSMSGRTLIRA